MSETKEIVLEADIYDALHLSSVAFGGIGGDLFGDDDECPVCIYGHAHFLDGGSPRYCGDPSPVRDALIAVGVHAGGNDLAVERINRRRGRGLTARVPFLDLCQELRVVRGPSA